MPDHPQQNWTHPIARAESARQQAYAPYSKFAVGAALQSDKGEVHVGTNVENCAYGSTICAERHAVGAAIVAGIRTWRAIAIVTDSPALTTPCGACLQVLSEMKVPTVILHNLRDGQTSIVPLDQLLPAAPVLQFLADP